MRTRIISVAFLSFSPRSHRQCRHSYFSQPYSSSSSIPPRPSPETPSSSDPLDKAKIALTRLSTRSASWKRFEHVLELAVTDTVTHSSSSVTTNATRSLFTAVDIGTDHGMLAVALAASGLFPGGVLGIDVSEQALQSGALATLARLETYWRDTQRPPLPVQCRVGQGLRSLAPGQADLVCIAGMGVHTMLDILTDTTTTADPAQQQMLLEHCASRRLVLQPTSARPRHLMTLYEGLHDIGWCLRDERLQKIGPRWYMSTSWEPCQQRDQPLWLPGQMLMDTDARSMAVFRSYLEHHCTWLRNDLNKTGRLDEAEARWLEMFQPLVQGK